MKINRQKVLDKYSGHCAYCGCELTLKTMQIDHLKPVMRQYKSAKMYKPENHCEENLMPSCRSCNISKSHWNLEQFRTNLRDRLNQLKWSATYKIAVRYGLLIENDKTINFYFELQEQDHE